MLNSQNDRTEDIEAFLILDNPTDAYIFHELPFKPSLQWIEYDVVNGRIDFILEEGELRNYGFNVTEPVGKYLRNINEICVAQKDGVIVLNEQFVPLVIHGQ